ncbi:MAG: hypothetical protein HYZ48_05755, partial [Chlamydiales bacterium]|nr:hypothetical protein [Chlamydiales bacterium]
MSTPLLSPLDNPYPQWGEVLGKPYAMPTGELIKKITVISVGIIAISTLTGVVAQAALIGICTGAALTGAIAVILIARALFCHFHRHRYKLEFTPEQPLSPSAPRLGQNSLADLRVSNQVNQTYKWKKDLIRSAEHSIEISFNYAGGEKL